MPTAATFSGDTVPLGEAGTGAAYILPQQSQGIQQGLDYIDVKAQAEANAKAAAQKQAQQLAKDWQTNRLSIKGGTLWQPEINKKVSDVTNEGMGLMKDKIDPTQYYNDPAKQARVDAYNQYKQEAMQMGDVRDAYTKQAAEYDKMIAEDNGEIDPASVDAYHAFFKTSLADHMKNGDMMPGPKKAYQMQKGIDALKSAEIETKSLPDQNGVVKDMVLPDHDANIRTASNFVNNTPQMRSRIEKNTGMSFDQIGDETDPAVIKKQLDDHYRSLPNIPSLAAQGVTTYGNSFGSAANSNSNGIPDQTGPPMQPTTQPGSAYDNLITREAQIRANAAKMKQSDITDTAQQLDDNVHKKNMATFSDEYNQAQDRRIRMGWDRQKFSDYVADRQNDSGTLTIGNQNSYVPVMKQYVNQDHGGSAGAEPEKGASLYGVNLPAVSTVVRPASVTDMKTGKTVKNTEPMDVKISQIQMVPVFKGLQKDAFNGSEISARQLKEIIAGTNKNGASLNNITFQPFAYGIKSEHDANNVHTINTPIKFSYDAIKGSNIKKINTTTFDNATEQLKAIQANPKFQGLTPEQKIDFLSKKYNLNLD